MRRVAGIVAIAACAALAAACGGDGDGSTASGGGAGATELERCNDRLDALVEQVKTESTAILVSLSERITERQLNELRDAVSELDGVESVTYTDKAEALEQAKELFKDSPDVIENLPGNPFPATLRVTLESPSLAEEVSEQLAEFDGVDDAAAPRLASLEIDVIENFRKHLPETGCMEQIDEQFGTHEQHDGA